MSNVNMTKDRRNHTTPCHPDPGFAEEVCPHWCECAAACVLVARRRVHGVCVCVGEEEQRLHLVWATEFASVKLFCRSLGLVGSSSEVERGQARSRRGLYLKRLLTQAPPPPPPRLQPVCSLKHSRTTLSTGRHIHLVWKESPLPTKPSPPPPPHSMQCNYMWRKRGGTPWQILVIGSWGSLGLIWGRRLGGADAGVTLLGDICRSWLRFVLVGGRTLLILQSDLLRLKTECCGEKGNILT